MKKLSKLYLGIVFFFLYAPIFVLIVFSFNQSKSRSVWTGFTLDWYVKLFHNEVILNSLWTTLSIALIAGVVSTILGTAAAMGISSMRRGPRRLVINTTYLPIMNPEILTGVSLMLLFSFLAIPRGYLTLVIAHTTFCVPYVILSVLPKLRQMDRFVYEAALDLGCSPRKAFFKAVVPQIMPGIMTGFLMALTYSIDDFVISYFVSGSSAQTLPITIYSMTRRRVSPEINALSTILFLAVLTVLLLINVKDAKIWKERRKKEAARL